MLVCGLSFVDRCFVVCRLLCAVFWLLSNGNCFLRVNIYLLFAGCCLLFAVCRLLFVVCRVLFVVCCLSVVVWRVSSVV